MEKQYKKHAKISGIVVMLGLGSVGRGLLPLLQRHIEYDDIKVIDPFADPPTDPNVKFSKIEIKEDNYIKVFDEAFEGKKGFLINVCCNVQSAALMHYCQEREILYIDTDDQEWAGFYFDPSNTKIEKSIYMGRVRLRQEWEHHKRPTTAVSCCGANPGFVSWLVKKALINLAKDINFPLEKQPEDREGWAKLMQNLGVKGLHIAQRDTQYINQHRPPKAFWNTWSVQGFSYQALQQLSELGWGTHEKKKPSFAGEFTVGKKCSIYLKKIGMHVKVKSWCPTLGPQFGYLLPHHQCLSLAQYFTVWEGNKAKFRPTTLFAYQPSEVTITSLMECLGAGIIPDEDQWRVLKAEEIVDGYDELGVFLFGHEKNAYWYGSQLTIHEAKKRIPEQNATGLQVAAGTLAGVIWAIENPKAGLVETEYMDYKRCLQVIDDYIGPLNGYYTDWKPSQNRIGEQKQATGQDWQFLDTIYEAE